MFYPSINDTQFYENIYKKKEFYQNRVPKENRTAEEICSAQEFRLMPNQEFLRNFISRDTPYNGLLIYHGTGFGKTCSAISIAEGFKDYTTKRILIILGSSIRRNFMKQIFNLEKEISKPNPSAKVQCTGDEYNIGSRNLTPPQRQRRVNELIRQYYEFIGPEQLSNYVMKKLTSWDGNPKTLSPQIIKAIQREYSNRVIIIDEVQNIKTLDTEKDVLKKRAPIIIETIIKYATNVRLVLMSATPMFNSPREIVYILNLLLLNDGRPTLKEKQLFTKDDMLTDEGTTLLLETSRGYISYLMAKNPLVFPVKVYPPDAKVPKNISETSEGTKIPENDQIHLSKLINLPMSQLQHRTYQQQLGPKGRIEGTGGKLTDIGNIVLPTSTPNKMQLGRKGFRDFPDGNGAFTVVYDTYRDPFTQKSRKTMYFRYQNHVILNRGKPNEKPFFDLSLIELVSPKFHSIIRTISASKGIAFVYSQNIWSGVLPLALALEQNGFQRYSFPGEAPSLLDYSVNSVGGGGKRRPICYLCGGDMKDKVHNRESKTFDHDFEIAKYVLLTGETDITHVDANDAATQVNKTSNAWGKDIKVVLGTSVAGEGIDFQRLRQVHILEPWFNYSRLEQVIGRADRNCSHISLPEPERNVEIYQYVAVFPSNSGKKQAHTETIDLKNYRLAENKFVRTKRVEDVLRRGAIDCALTKNANVTINRDLVIHTASGERFTYNPKKQTNLEKIYSLDIPTDYECVWEPPADNTKTKTPSFKINTDTYNIRYAKSDIDKIEQYIMELYGRGNIYDLDAIMSYISSKMELVEPKFVYKALSNILQMKDNAIRDKYGRRGNLIYRGTYYIWQPEEIPFKRLPMYYRSTPLTTKTKHLIVDDLAQELKTTDISEANTVSCDVCDMTEKEREKVANKLQSELKDLTSKLEPFIKANFKQMNEKLMTVILHYVLDRYTYMELTKVGIWLLLDAGSMKNHITKTITQYLQEHRVLIKNNKQLDNETVLLLYEPQLKSKTTVKTMEKHMPMAMYCLDKSKLKVCDAGLEQKVKYWIQQQPVIFAPTELPKNTGDSIGLVILNRNRQNPKTAVDFKIVDVEKSGKTKSGTKKLALPRGRVCTTLTTDDSKQLQVELDITPAPRSNRTMLCVQTEIMFRYNDLIHKNKHSWLLTLLE